MLLWSQLVWLQTPARSGAIRDSSANSPPRHPQEIRWKDFLSQIGRWFQNSPANPSKVTHPLAPDKPATLRLCQLAADARVVLAAYPSGLGVTSDGVIT